MISLTLREHTSPSYVPRTWHNAKVSDATLAFAIDFSTAGEKLTAKAAAGKIFTIDMEDDWQLTPQTRAAQTFLKERKAEVLNIAGNGIYSLSHHFRHGQHVVDEWVFYVLRFLIQSLPIRKIVCGGQTGADMAGARAGLLLDLPVEVTFPRGYKIRDESGRDIEQTQEQAAIRIITQAELATTTQRQQWLEEWRGGIQNV